MKSNHQMKIIFWRYGLQRWREFDEKLRSDTFLNLLDKYVNSSLDLFNDIYNNGYISPQLIYHDFIDLYLKYFSSFISYSKEL